MRVKRRLETRPAATGSAGKARLAMALVVALGAVPLLAPSQAAHAESTKPRPAGKPPSPWSYCERAAIAIETTEKLPRALLFSVSTAESGRFDKTTGKARPWPWTINAEGQSFYFDSKRDAVAATRRLLKSGVRSIDVGCMQINLRYHPDAFASLNEAFDPVTNATYAASFLKQLYRQTSSWPSAVAQYHSESPERNRPYFARVIRIWSNERERVVALTRVLKREAMAEVAQALRGATDAPIELSAEPARPAPMVLDTADTRDVREGAVATVGLRLSIAEETAASVAERPAPRVIDTPTILADASRTPSL